MLRLLLVLHVHQPVGNFDKVIQDAVDRSYRPFLEEMDRHPGIPFALHASGPLLEWLEAHEPRLLDRIAHGAEAGRIEVLGGGFGEPILPMIPHRDRVRQVVELADWIERRLGVRPRGAWLSERVWEAGLASSLAEAGVEYTFLDDAHFLAAGRDESELRGAFVLEDGGRTLRVFPISERLRYEIPFATVEKVLAGLRAESRRDGSPLLCYGDDGEKFGVWPHTFEHVYENGWLREFLDALEQAQDEVRAVLPGEAADTIPPVGRVYLPDSSYREMNEWTLPIGARRRYEEAARLLEERLPGAGSRGLLRGGVWRSFLVRYPESNLMVSRMLRASARVAAIPEEDAGEARRDLYRGQCHCGYWHGIFGGLYLPHLRTAIYRHLLLADRRADRDPPPIRVEVLDHDRDGLPDVVLETPRLSAVLAPGRGGHLVDLSHREGARNLLDVLARRPEYEHEEIRRAPAASSRGEVRTIHDAAVEDAARFREHLVFDEGGLESLTDRILRSDGREVGSFASGAYEILEARAGPGGGLLRMRRRDAGARIAIEKTVRLDAGGGTLRVDYRVLAEAAVTGDLVVEVTVGVPGGDTFGRRYLVDDIPVPGNLVEVVRRSAARSVDVLDDAVGFGLRVEARGPARLDADPIRTVSRSEAGFEMVFQAARLRFAWPVRLAAGGRHETRLDLIPAVR